MTEHTVEPLMGDDRVIDDIHSWVRYGVERGWISEPVCATHDGIPATVEESVDWEEGHDPCQAVLRLWPDGYSYTEEDHIGGDPLTFLVEYQPEPLEGPMKIEMDVVNENGAVRNVIHVDGVERKANVQVITAIGGTKVVFLDGQQVKDAEVWHDGVLIAKVPGIEDLAHQPYPAS